MPEERYTYLVARPVYVYVRSRKPIEDDDEASDAAIAMFNYRMPAPKGFEEAEVISPADQFDTFADGFVVRLKTNKTLDEIRTEWAEHLSKFEAWAIHDGKRDVREADGNLGTVRAALDAVRSGPMPVTQAFLIYHPSSEDGQGIDHQNLLADAIMASWRVKARTAFRFANGRVLFVSPDVVSDELVVRMSGRYPAEGRRAFHEMAFDDGDGEAGRLYFGEEVAWSPFDFKDC